MENISLIKRLKYIIFPPINQESRMAWIDIIRGITVISMVLYHFLWDINYLTDINMSWYEGYYGNLWQKSICWAFILISGFCLQMSKRPLKRGITVFVLGWVITVVTNLMGPGVAIWFGILTFIGSAMIIIAILKDVLIKIPASVGTIIFMLLFGATMYINRGYLTFGKLGTIDLPRSLYSNYFTAFLGFPPAGFASADYFSVVPWIFLFAVGFYLFKIYKLNVDEEKENTSARYIPVISWVGQHSLFIYIIHQPIAYGLALLIRQVIN